jgi:hypothetical protein
MRKIETLTELKAERIRLRQKKMRLESEIENNFNTLKESFAPLQLVTDGAAKMLVNKNHGIANETISMILDFILKKVVLRNSGFILRLILPLIARNTANNLLTENKTKILGWIGDLILKASSRKNHKPIYDKATADIDF